MSRVLAPLFFTFLLTVSSPSSAAIMVLESQDIGTVESLDNSGPEAFAGFSIGDVVGIRIEFDDTTADSRSDVGAARYDDLDGKLILFNSTGASVEYGSGVRLEFDDRQEMEIRSISTSPTSGSPVLSGDIDLDTRGVDFFTDVDDLSQTFSDLAANTFSNDATQGSTTRYEAGAGDEIGMSISEAPSQTQWTVETLGSGATVVPEPTSIAVWGFVLIGFLGFGIRRQNRVPTKE